MRFRDRAEAGRNLADEVARLDLDEPVVLALPRGGVPVGAQVAARLRAPFDVFVTRKIGAPHQREFGIGAVAEGGTVVADHDALAALGLSAAGFERLAEEERAELDRRVRRYRGDRPMVEVAGRDVVLVDDGLATGVTAEAALRALRGRGPRSLVLAVPVGAPDTVRRLATVADEVVCVHAPAQFSAVGLWYDVFDQTSDEEVVALLEAPREQAVTIPQHGGIAVQADLTVPTACRGAVVFAHGSGSSRRSERNRRVANRLQSSGLATLLLDLLTDEEEVIDQRSAQLRFDIPLLAARLEGAIEWLRREPRTSELAVGAFGASTGAAAALVAAARRPDDVAAVVSRGGRPDLAGPLLGAVRAPTLLIVGGADAQVLALNREAAAALAAEHRLVVIPGATHLFEEPGAMEQVAELAAEWFEARLEQAAGPASLRKRSGSLKPATARPT
jgi:putative phosphoribosyl transferase